jgi:hypothetical protein
VGDGGSVEAISSERRFQSEDAWRSATWVAVLVGAIAVVVLATSWTELPSGMRPVFLSMVATSPLMLGYLFAIRRGTQPRFFTALALVQTLPFLFVFPFAAVEWTKVGRPAEVFWSVKLAMLMAALVIPRSLTLGLVFTLSALLEVPLLLAILRRMGVPPLMMPAFEPQASIGFAIAAVALLFLAHRRRMLIVRHLRADAEVETLRPLAQALEALGRRLDVVVASVEKLLDANGDQTSATTGRTMRGATERLTGVRSQLAELADGGAAAPVTGPAPSDAALTSAERELFARDAYNGSMTLSAIIALVGTVAFPVLNSVSGFIVWGFVALLSYACFIALWLTRHRPSTRGALAVFVCLIVASLPAVATTNIGFRSLQSPFEPYQGVKILMAVVPLTIPRYLWLGLATEGVLAAEAFALFYGLDLTRMRHLVPLVEPWSILLFAAVGVLLVQQREQRQAASLRLLRAQAERTALTRRATICLALRDQINSPLQVLHIGLAVIKTRPAGEAALDEARKGLTEIAAGMPEVDDLVRRGLGSVSFDAAAALKRNA